MQSLVKSFKSFQYDKQALIYIVLATFSINILSFAFPIVLLQTYDRVIPNQAMETFTALVIGVVLAVILEVLLRIARTLLTGWADARFEYFAENRAFSKIIVSPVNEFEKEGVGLYLERMNATHGLKDFYMGQVLITLIDFPFVLIFLGLMAYLSGWLALVPLTMIGLFVLRTWIKAPGLRAELENKRGADERRFNFIIEVLSSIHCVKSMVMEAPMLRRYERLQQANSATNFKIGKKGTEASRFSLIVSQAALMGIACFGGYLVIQGELSIGELAASVLLTGRCLQPTNRAISIWARHQSISLSEKQLHIIENMPQEYDSENGIRKKIKGDIQIQDVSYINSGEQTIFENINLSIKPGEAISIQGRSLSGKTTILHMIMGLVKPTSGRVMIDGDNVRDYKLDKLRQQIVYLSHNDTLFHGSIMENLTGFQGKSMMAEAKSAAKLLGIHDAIARLPEGYDTLVGNRAVEALPKGIKQQLSLARVFITRPKMILFDEANNALDFEADRKCQEVLKSLYGKCCLILVSHRPSLLSVADKHYKIQDRKLVEVENV